jgi:hypothetical protein
MSFDLRSHVVSCPIRRPMCNDQMNRCSRQLSRFVCGALPLFVAFLASSVCAASPPVRAVALRGWQAPGTESGTVFTSFNPFDFALNDAGQVAFQGYFSGASFGGIWTEGAGGLHLIARNGDVPPNLPEPIRYDQFSAPILNEAGQIGFWASLSDGCCERAGSGIWAGGANGLALVARDEMDAPGTPDEVRFSNISATVFNNAGQTAFRSGLAGADASADEAVWSSGGGSLALVARKGRQAVDLPAGVNYDYFSAPLLNNAGHTAFQSYLSGAGVDATNFHAVWSEGSGTLALVARSGDQAPGAPSGAKFDGFSDPALNDAGRTAFWGYLAGPAAGEPLDDGIWLEGNAGLNVVARRGQQAPGTAAGVLFATNGLNTFDSPVLDNRGEVAFRATIDGPGVDETNHEGLWIGKSEHLALLARTGDHAAGTPDGVAFDGFLPYFGGLELNDFGQAAFTAYFRGDDVPGVAVGIWATDRSGELQLIARVGGSIEVAPGDLRTIQQLSLVSDGTGNGDGKPSGLNNRGQVAFWALYTDGEGIFVSDVAAVPEPSAQVLAIVACLVLCGASGVRNCNRTVKVEAR